MDFVKSPFLMDLRVGANTNRYGAAGWRTLLQGGAKAPRHPSTPRGLFYAPTLGHRKTNPRAPLSEGRWPWREPGEELP